MQKQKPYQEARTKARIAYVTLCDIAVQAGISESTMMRWLREPERPERKVIISTALQEIITERSEENE